MKHEFRLADIGEGLEEAEIISWLVAVGDQVSRDQPLIEVMTDKSNAELPAPTGGTVTELGGSVGDILSVGALIAIIDDAELSSDDDMAANEMIAEQDAATQAQPIEPSADPPPVVETPDPSATPARIKASPSTRREAAKRGIDLTTVQGSGPGGRVLLTDLDRPADSPPAPPSIVIGQPAGETAPLQAPAGAPSPPPSPEPALPRATTAAANSLAVSGTTVPLRGIRRAVAQNMARSWFDIPHIHTFAHIDAQPMLDLRQRLKASRRPGYETLTPLTFFVAALAAALRSHPEANASIAMAEETITYHPNINIGVAVAAPNGLVVPVLRDADTLGFEDLCTSLGSLVQGARSGTLDRASFSDGTATITNFGSLGGEQGDTVDPTS